MYVKMIGSLFLMSSATAIGYLKAEELRERVKKLQELKRMMEFLQGELRFHRSELSEAFGNVGKRVEEPFCSFLKMMEEQLREHQAESFEGLWEHCSKQLVLEEGFLKKDLQLVEVLGKGLGYLDLTMQTETLNQAIIRTEEEIQEAKKQQQNKGKLYQTMGITAGALLTLLMV